MWRTSSCVARRSTYAMSLYSHQHLCKLCYQMSFILGRTCAAGSVFAPHKDMGSAGWYMRIFLMNGAKLRGTISWDILHRLFSEIIRRILTLFLERRQCNMFTSVFVVCNKGLHNDILDAATESGLILARLEAAQVCSLRRGPQPICR